MQLHRRFNASSSSTINVINDRPTVAPIPQLKAALFLDLVSLVIVVLLSRSRPPHTRCLLLLLLLCFAHSFPPVNFLLRLEKFKNKYIVLFYFYSFQFPPHFTVPPFDRQSCYYFRFIFFNSSSMCRTQVFIIVSFFCASCDGVFRCNLLCRRVLHCETHTRTVETNVTI